MHLTQYARYLPRVFYPFIALIAISSIVSDTSSQAVIGLAFIAVVIYGLMTKDRFDAHFVVQPEVGLLLIFCSYALLSLLWSPWDEPILLVKELVRIAIVIGLIGVFAWLANDSRLQKLDLWFIGLWAAFGIYLIVDALLSSLPHFRAFQQAITEPGLFYHHAPTGWIFAMVILLSLPRLLDSVLITKLLLLVACIIAFTVMIMAQSRGAYVGLIAGIVSFAFFRGGTIGRWLVIGTCVLTICFVAVYLLFDFQAIDSLIDRADSHRRYIYINAWKVVTQHPYFGHGFGASSINKVGFTAFHYHNIYIGTVFYGGITALLLFSAMVVTFLLKCYRKPKTDGWYSVVIMALTIFLFDGNHFVTYPSAELYIFVLPMLVAVALRLQLTKSE